MSNAFLLTGTQRPRPIAEVATDAGVEIPMVVDINVGMDRTGVAPGAPAFSAILARMAPAYGPSGRADGVAKRLGWRRSSGMTP